MQRHRKAAPVSFSFSLLWRHSGFQGACKAAAESHDFVCNAKTRLQALALTYFALAGCLVFAALRPSSGPLWSRGPTWLLTIKTRQKLQVSIP